MFFDFEINQLLPAPKAKKSKNETLQALFVLMEDGKGRTVAEIRKEVSASPHTITNLLINHNFRMIDKRYGKAVWAK
jgi:hypothetical protein